MQINGLKVFSATDPQQVAAHAGTVGSNALVVLTWITQFQSILQIVLMIVGIGAGIASWRWYRAQRKALEKKDE